MAPWAAGKNAKESARRWAESQSAASSAWASMGPYRWKDAVQGQEEIRIWVADGIANGMRPWFTKFAGTINDPRWLKPVEELYAWHHGVEATSATRPAGPGRAGLFPADRLVPRGPGARTKVEDRGPGLVPGADRGEVPFEMVHDRLLDASSGAVPDAHPSEHRRPLRRAVRAAQRVCRPGRRARGDLRDLPR